MKHRAASIRQMSAPTVRASEPINSSRQAASHKPRWATASKLMTKTPVPATRKPYGQPTSSNNNNQLQLQLQPMRTSKLHVAIKTRRRRQQRRLVTSSSSAQPRVLANCRTYADDADFTTITSPLLPSTPIVALALLVIATGTACWTSTGQHQSKLIGLVEAAPIQLVADFSTYAFSVLANQQQQQLEAMHRQLSEQVAASNSLRAGFASGGSPNGPDEDPDEVAADNAAAHAAAAQNDSIPVTGIGGESFSSLLRSDFGANQDDEDDLQSLNETTVMVAAGTTTNTNSMTNSSLDLANRPLLVTSTSGAGGPAAGPSTKMRTGPGVTGGHFIYLPNGQSVQFCEENKAELGCLDANAVCKMGACVCKPGFFQTRQSSLCQSISDLLKNCENDLQCQAFNVDLVCDTKSHERPFCDCTPGLYFDQETHTCFPCHRNTFIFTTTTSGGGTTGESSPMIGLGDTVSKTTNSTATNGTTAGSASASTTATILPNAAGGTSAASATTTLKPCRPIDIAKIKLKQRLFNLLPSFPPGYDDSGERLQVLASGAGMSSSNTAAGAPTISSAHPNSVHSSDPFRIKTPLEVFMGAIMLFTLFTVAWFFLQRIIHDCRTIMKSIRAGTDEMMAGGDPNFTGAFGTSTTHHTTAHHLSGLGGESSLEVAAMGGHHSLGPGGGLQSAASSLAAARFAAALASGADPDYMETSPGFFARRRSANSPGIGYMATTLAGAYHRSLAAGLMAAANGAGGTNSATTTLSSSHTTTPLATAVTNSGQNSAATRSAITRLVGDDTDDELVASIYPFIESPSSYHHGGGGREVGRNNATAGFEHHPGLAILRVAMAAQSRLANYPSHHQFPPGCMPINYLNPNFEPPPKYEEAIAQDNGCQQPNYLQNHHHHHPHNQTTVSPSSPVSSRGATPTNIDQPTVTNNMSINDDEEELQHNSHNRHEQENTNQLDQNRSSTVSPPTGTQSSQSGDISSGDNNNNTQNCAVTNTINGEPADINEHNNWDNNSHSN